MSHELASSILPQIQENCIKNAGRNTVDPNITILAVSLLKVDKKLIGAFMKSAIFALE